MMQQDHRQAIIYARMRGRDALQAFAEDHLPLVAALVRRFPPGLHEPEELYQQGCIGLMKAIARYSPEWGTAFSTYAVPLILGEMRMLSRQTASVHIPRPERELRMKLRRTEAELARVLSRDPTTTELAEAMRMDPADMMLVMDDVIVSSLDEPNTDGCAPLDRLSDQTDWLSKVELKDLLDRLPERDREMIRLRYIEGLSQRETAEKLGMTQVQISRREAVLRRQLRREWYGE